MKKILSLTEKAMDDLMNKDKVRVTMLMNNRDTLAEGIIDVSKIEFVAGLMHDIDVEDGRQTKEVVAKFLQIMRNQDIKYEKTSNSYSNPNSFAYKAEDVACLNIEFVSGRDIVIVAQEEYEDITG